MTHYIDETFWKAALHQPNWYHLLATDFDRLEALATSEPEYAIRKAIKREAYSLVEQAFTEGTLPIASRGPNLDKARKPLDSIVIHHTKNPSGMTLERLNAIHLLRIYGRYFNQDRQVFWGYHWLIRADGTAERILDDRVIGWHAGNWDINTRSVGICIDDDLASKEPSTTVIGSMAALIQTQYQHVEHANIIGHCDVNNKTACPGELFNIAWRLKLLDRIGKNID
jgi:hypothetical protein